MSLLERSGVGQSVPVPVVPRFFSNFSTKPQFLYEGAIFLKKFNIKN